MSIQPTIDNAQPDKVTSIINGLEVTISPTCLVDPQAQVHKFIGSIIGAATHLCAEYNTHGMAHLLSDDIWESLPDNCYENDDGDIVVNPKPTIPPPSGALLNNASHVAVQASKDNTEKRKSMLNATIGLQELAVQAVPGWLIAGHVSPTTGTKRIPIELIIKLAIEEWGVLSTSEILELEQEARALRLSNTADFRQHVIRLQDKFTLLMTHHAGLSDHAKRDILATSIKHFPVCAEALTHYTSSYPLSAMQSFEDMAKHVRQQVGATRSLNPLGRAYGANGTTSADPISARLDAMEKVHKADMANILQALNASGGRAAVQGLPGGGGRNGARNSRAPLGQQTKPIARPFTDIVTRPRPTPAQYTTRFCYYHGKCNHTGAGGNGTPPCSTMLNMLNPDTGTDFTAAMIAATSYAAVPGANPN
jgi:hypothetical protein